MRGVIQSRTGNRGTCFRASLASILNLREYQVPDFQAANQDPGVDKFLSKYGLRYVEFPITPANAPVGYHFILGVSPRGGEHAIVGKDGRGVWDPHPASDGTGQGLVKPERYGVLVNEFERAKDSVAPDDFCDGCDRPMSQCICGRGEFGARDFRRVRLHRTLDYVMDKVRAKDSQVDEDARLIVSFAKSPAQAQELIRRRATEQHLPQFAVLALANKVYDLMKKQAPTGMSAKEARRLGLRFTK